MIKLSLDDEPPSKFEGKKEMNRKKSEPLSQLIFSLKSGKNKIKSTNSRKNLEEQIKSNWNKHIFNSEYLKTNKNFSENKSTSTVNIVEFTDVTSTNQNQSMSNFNYGLKKSGTEFPEKKISNFYEMSSSDYFVLGLKEENKKEDLYKPQKEEEEEIPYMIYNFWEEEQEQESLK